MRVLFLAVGMLLPFLAPSSGALSQELPPSVVYEGKVSGPNGDVGMIRLEVLSKGDRIRLAGGSATVNGVVYRVQSVSYHPDGDEGHATLQLIDLARCEKSFFAHGVGRLTAGGGVAEGRFRIFRPQPAPEQGAFSFTATRK